MSKPANLYGAEAMLFESDEPLFAFASHGKSDAVVTLKGAVSARCGIVWGIKKTPPRPGRGGAGVIGLLAAFQSL